MARKPTQEELEIKLLEEMAADPELKATQRLRALEELGKRRARTEAIAREEPSDLSQDPDPFEDLDELEQQRLRRVRRR